MKKLALALATLALVTSCKNLAENEFELKGITDPSWEGRVITLQKQTGAGRGLTLDTMRVKDASFTLRDTVSAPGIYFLRVDGHPGEQVDFVLEPGEIEINIDKDTLYKSRATGTYNNEKYFEFKDLYNKVMKRVAKFQQDNLNKYNEAKGKEDEATVSQLENTRTGLIKDVDKEIVAFVKQNPKAYVSLNVLGEIHRLGQRKPDEIKALFNGLDSSIKNTKEGKMIEKFLNPEKAVEQPAPEQPKAVIKVGDKAPDFTAKTPDGKDLSLKEALGKKATIIDFWASWCGPCRKENPHIVALYKKYHDKGLNIIGVSLDKEETAWKNAIAKDQLNWFHVSNLKFWEDPIAKMYGVEAIPAPFLLDADGKVVARDLTGDQLETEIQKLVK